MAEILFDATEGRVLGEMPKGKPPYVEMDAPDAPTRAIVTGRGAISAKDICRLVDDLTEAAERLMDAARMAHGSSFARTAGKCDYWRSELLRHVVRDLEVV